MKSPDQRFAPLPSDPLIPVFIENPSDLADDRNFYDRLLSKLKEMGMDRDDLLLTGHCLDPTEPELPLRRTFALTLAEYRFEIETSGDETPLYYARTSDAGTPIISVYDPDVLVSIPDGIAEYEMPGPGQITEALIARFDVSDWI